MDDAGDSLVIQEIKKAIDAGKEVKDYREDYSFRKDEQGYAIYKGSERFSDMTFLLMPPKREVLMWFPTCVRVDGKKLESL